MNYGKCPSKKETYFGFKIHALITLEGYITAFEITSASIDDREGLKDLTENLSGFAILGDKEYAGKNLYQFTQKKSDCKKFQRTMYADDKQSSMSQLMHGIESYF